MSLSMRATIASIHIGPFQAHNLVPSDSLAVGIEGKVVGDASGREPFTEVAPGGVEEADEEAWLVRGDTAAELGDAAAGRMVEEVCVAPGTLGTAGSDEEL